MQQVYALFAFALGAFAPNFYWAQPGFAYLLPVALVLGALFYRVRRFWVIAFFLGLAYGAFTAVEFAQALLPERLSNQKFQVEARVVGIPERGTRSWRLDLLAERLQPLEPDQTLLSVDSPRKLRLSYYGHPPEGFRAGDLLQFEAKLRRPHGLMNPGLFDYQRWLIGEGYSATGYIVRLDQQRSLAANDWRSRLDRWRGYRAEQIQQAEVLRPGLQAALTLGDRRFVDDDLWQLFVDTGVIHLMVISGLHVGFVAGMAYLLTRGCLSLCSPLTGINARRWATLGALLAAALYAAVAGFSTPTVRALIMLWALFLPYLLLLRTFHWWGFALALALVALLDPRAVLQNGFWLSFAAVALIFLSLDMENKRGFWRGLARLQLVFFLGFAAVIVLVQGSFSPISFVANLFAVPLTSALIVPLELAGLVAVGLSDSLALWCWKLAGQLLDFQVFVLASLDELAGWKWQRVPLPWWLSLLSAAAGLSLFVWRRWWQRGLAFLLILPLFVPLADDDFLLEVRVFDVGQGLAVLVRQPGYSLVYDTGPRFSDNFDAGADILLPILQQLRIRQIDDLVVSHPDADHFGGYAGLVEQLPAARVWLGRQPQSPVVGDECRRDVRWQVGAVHYEFLYPDNPDPGAEVREDNDRSCVLQIRFVGQSILLPGDIGKPVEQQLLAQSQLRSSYSLVLIPHHGSKSSSSSDFVRALQPQVAIASAGYLNRFGHPAEEVMDRYHSVGAQTLTTAQTGMIRLLWRAGVAKPEVHTEAERRIFWWQK